jgi:hypothetical protein
MTSTVEQDRAEHAGTGRRATWALWGTAAGVLGVVANLFTQPVVTDADRMRGPEAVVEMLSRGGYHVAAIAGVGAAVALLVFTAGFRRWSERQSGDSLALRLVPVALTASAAAMLTAYTVKGQLAIYLDGGINAGSYQTEALYTFFILDDLAGFGAWWGVIVFAAATIALAFRDRLVVRWVGALAALAVLAPVGFLLSTGLTGFPGVIGPVWLTLAGIGMALRRE